jgi:hypothetical protein
MQRAIITGITGQDGSYLTELLLSKGYEVHGLIRPRSIENTSRLDHLTHNTDILGTRLFLHYGDLFDKTCLQSLIQTVKEVRVHARLRFFPPRLDPVLDRGTRDNDTVIAPEVPTRGPVGPAVLDHQPYRQSNHAVGVRTAGGRQIGEVRVKVLATLRTGVLRRGDHQITRTPQVEIPSVVERPIERFIPVSLVIAARTRLTLVGTTVSDDLWWWQVCNRGHPFGGIRSIRPRTEHGLVLLARMLGSALYAKRLTGAIPKPGKDTIVSEILRVRRRSRGLGRSRPKLFVWSSREIF